MFTRLKFTFLALLASASLEAYSPTSTSYEDMRESYRKKGEDIHQENIWFENYMQYDASEEMQEIAYRLEKDLFDVMYLYTQIVESVLTRNSPLLIQGCSNSIMPLVQVVCQSGELVQELRQIIESYIFVEEERDLMRQANIDEFVAYIDATLLKLFALIDALDISNEENSHNYCFLRLENKVEVAINNRFFTTFQKTDALTQQIFINIIHEIKNYIPALHEIYKEFTHNLVFLKKHIACNSDEFGSFVLYRMHKVCGVLQEPWGSAFIESYDYFMSKELEDVSQDDIKLFLECTLQAAVRSKAVLEQYRKRN